MIAPPRSPSHDQLEALIKEARDRQRRRRLLAAALIAIAAALGIVVHSVLAGGRATIATRAHSTAVPAGSCRMVSLAVSEFPLSNPTGLDRIGFRLVNKTATSCSIGGYPVLRFTDATGTLPFLIRRLGMPHERTLAAHGSAFAVMSKFRCDIGVQRSAGKTLLALPGDPTATIAFVGGPSICAPGIPAEGRWVTLTPFESLRAAYIESLVGNGTGP